MSKVLALSLLVPLVASCGDDSKNDGLRCGPGTVAVGGECLPEGGDSDVDTDADTDTDTGSDCADDDPLDPLGVDDNCDGAEGVADRGIYLWWAGDDLFSGSPDSPVVTLARALEIARDDALRRFVFVAEGPTIEGSGVADLLELGCEVVGGLVPDLGWSRRELLDLSRGTTLEVPAAGVVVTGADDGALRYLTIVSAGSDPDHVVLVAEESEGLELEVVTLRAAAGGPGDPGAPTDAPDRTADAWVGGDAAGANGGEPAVIAPEDQCGEGTPRGGAGGDNTIETCAAQAGEGGAAYWQIPEAGAIGAPGSGGAGVSFDGVTHLFGSSATDGGRGFMGDGGGGAQCTFAFFGGCGEIAPGGAGGAGGCGGWGGSAATDGGHSIPLVVIGDFPSFDTVALQAGSGGDAAAGGDGGAGAPGARGGAGEQYCEFDGLHGGPGGIGGQGGGGGGGAGGWSTGLLVVGAAETPALPAGVVVSLGAGGAGGAGGLPNGAAGAPGEAHEVHAIP